MRKRIRELVDLKFFNFFLMYFFFHAGTAVYNVFISLYLRNTLNFSNTQIGVLLAVSPVVVILSQPVWGIITDRAKHKNTVFLTTIACGVACVLAVPLFKNFWYLLVMMMLLPLFRPTAMMLADTITIEHAGNSGMSYGVARGGGGLGYAVMALIAGTVIQGVASTEVMFPLYAIVSGIAFAIGLSLPKIKGHQHEEGKRKSYSELFKNKYLIFVLVFYCIIRMSVTFFESFGSLHFNSIGASDSLIGALNLLSSGSEFPILLISMWIMRRFSLEKMLVAFGFINTVRWLLTALITNPYLLLVVQPTHGMNMLAMVALGIFISRSVAPELRTSGQSLMHVLTSVVGFASSLFSGIAADAFGYQTIFIFFSCLSAGATILWALFVFKGHRTSLVDPVEPEAVSEKAS